MPFKKKERSPSSTALPSTEAAQPEGPLLSEKEHDAANKVLSAIYDYRTQDGFDPSKLFHRKVNKRVIPEYYDTIKEPIALSTIKQKLNISKSYRDMREFVRDFALIPHNAQVFNRPDSGAFQDALVIKEQLEKQLQLLVDEGVITKEVATLPDLGEIPTYEDVPMEDAPAAEEESSDDEGEEDDDEEEEELDDEGRPKKRKGGRGSSKRQPAEDGGTEKKARGRPPKLLTPTEARIQAILKGIRKPKNQRGQLMIRDFDRLPDKQVMPEYYAEVKNPMAYDILKRKVKRKKYKSVEEFMNDVNLMFNNAKNYNQDDSAVYKHATALQIEAGRLYDVEKAKPDDTFADEEGKIPLPNGILHNGELYKVGDWVHLQNTNDLTKPIPAQIYRTYKSSKGENMVNVCWYYRPEQTVHRFDKHFYPNEVVKTGRYRDHHIEEVEGKCFIMFFTRYFKGRPRGLPEGQEIYVCEARYNETRHEFNKIKTWASCLPDEVRDKDYEMDLFDHPRKPKKVPSPIAYMLKDDQQETDDFPKVQWGADGAPPKIGAVHRRPRGDRDSVPPEPTPPPPPKQPTPPPRQAPTPLQAFTGQTPASQPQTAPRPISRQPIQSYNPSQSQQYNQQAAPSPAPRPPSAVQQQSSFNTPQTPQPQPTPLSRPPVPGPTYQQPAPPSIPPNPSTYAPRPTNIGSYRDPPPIEVYVLPDQANLSIPHEVREQYQRDEYGRVLFFTVPPVSVDDNKALRGHSVRYLAEKARRENLLAQKRQARDEERRQAERAAKRLCLEADERVASDLQELKIRALSVLKSQIAETTDLDDMDMRRLGEVQKMSREQARAIETNERRRAERRSVKLAGGTFADDWDIRLAG